MGAAEGVGQWIPRTHPSLRSAAAPNSSPAAGAETWLSAHCDPSQCSARGDENCGSRNAPTPPTAQTSFGPTATTPQRSLSEEGPPGLGLGTTDQREPFQCSINVWSSTPRSWFPYRPTAQMSSAATALTAVSQFWSVSFPLSGLGLCTCCQTLPLNRSVRVVSPNGFLRP